MEPLFLFSFKSVLTRLAELNCSIMHQSVILYLWCSSSLSPHSAVLKFGAKRDLQACKAPCELIVLYILLICNASWYRASRAPRPSERFKERREGIPFVLSVFCLLLSALAWCSLPAGRAAGPVWPSLSIAAPPVACRLSLSPVACPCRRNVLLCTAALPHCNPGRQHQAVRALLTQMLSTAPSPGRPFPGKPC